MAHIQRRCARCRRTVSGGARACRACGSRESSFVARYRSPGGTEKSKSYARKVDAERFLIGQESKKLRGEWVDPSAGKVQLQTFAEEWFEDASYLARTTRAGYGSLLRTHIYPAFGTYPVNTIRPSDLRAFVAGLIEKGLHPKTIGNAYRLLVGILRVAKEDGLIAGVPTPRSERGDRRRGVLPPVPKPEHHYKTAEEIDLLANAEPIAPRYRGLIYLGCYGALRWGELAGLRVSRLRLLERKVEVVETPEGEPKWGSAGTVNIPPEVADELAAHLAAFPPGPDGLVFTSPEGKPLNYHNFRARYWDRGVEEAGLGPMTPHDLRHSGVSLAIEAGAHPKEIQELCRHTSFVTTMNVYGHLFERLHKRLSERLGSAFREARENGHPVAAAGPLRDGGGTRVVPLSQRSR
jgi:integrase